MTLRLSVKWNKGLSHEAQLFCPRALADEIPQLLRESGYEVEARSNEPISFEDCSWHVFACNRRGAETSVGIVRVEGFHDCIVVISAPGLLRKLLPFGRVRRNRHLVHRISRLLQKRGAIPCSIKED